MPAVTFPLSGTYGKQYPVRSRIPIQWQSLYNTMAMFSQGYQGHDRSLPHPPGCLRENPQQSKCVYAATGRPNADRLYP